MKCYIHRPICVDTAPLACQTTPGGRTGCPPVERRASRTAAPPPSFPPRALATAVAPPPAEVFAVLVSADAARAASTPHLHRHDTTSLPHRTMQSHRRPTRGMPGIAYSSTAALVPRALSPLPSHLLQPRCLQRRSTPRVSHPRPTSIDTTPPTCQGTPGSAEHRVSQRCCCPRSRGYGCLA